MKGCLFFVGAGVVILGFIAINFYVASLPPTIKVTNNSGAQLQGLTVKALWAGERELPDVSNILLPPQTIEVGETVNARLPDEVAYGVYPTVSFTMNGQLFEEELHEYVDMSEGDLELEIDSEGKCRVLFR